MGLTDRVGKYDLFVKVTGERPYQSAISIPEFELPDEKVDEIYLEAMKMWRCYYSREDCLLEQYYRKDFQRLQDAYLKGDKERFKESLCELLFSINVE